MNTISGKLTKVSEKDICKVFDKRRTRICTRLVLRMFQLTCFGLAGYMVYVQIKTYFANKDLSTIAYKHFLNEAEDIFPVFTICAVGMPWSGILEGDRMPKNHHAVHYSRVVGGYLDDRKNYSKILFDHVVIDVNKFIYNSYTKPYNGKKTIRVKAGRYGQHGKNFSLKFNDLFVSRVCATKQDLQENTFVEREYIEFALYGFRNQLRNGHIDLDFYIHQKGQLLRQLKYPTYHLDRFHIKELVRRVKNNRNETFRKNIKIKIVNVDVLRKRPTSNEPCDPELQNEDNKMRHRIIETIGCIPSFTRPFFAESLIGNKSLMDRTCNKTQYRRIYQLYNGGFFQRKDWYTQPCTTMNAIAAISDPVVEANINHYTTYDYTRLWIDVTLDYVTDSYRETVNTLAFDMATFWSQVGGFIGIFLGYSLLQVPELVKNWLPLAPPLE